MLRDDYAMSDCFLNSAYLLFIFYRYRIRSYLQYMSCPQILFCLSFIQHCFICGPNEIPVCRSMLGSKAGQLRRSNCWARSHTLDLDPQDSSACPHDDLIVCLQYSTSSWFFVSVLKTVKLVSTRWINLICQTAWAYKRSLRIFYSNFMKTDKKAIRFSHDDVHLHVEKLRIRLFHSKVHL